MFHSKISLYAAAMFMAVLTPFHGLADSGIRDVTWRDLAPGGRVKQEYVRNASPLMSLLLDLKGNERPEPRMADDLEGKRIRLSGYVVPLKYSGRGVKEFLLVPYVGACVHVPPPPKNQIVLVTSAEPVKVHGLFQAVTVTGTISVAGSETEIAETGYRLTASRVSDYDKYRAIKRVPGHPDRDAAQ
jgi:uncharacterized protein